MNLQTFAILIYAARLHYHLFKTFLLNFGFLGLCQKKFGISHIIRFFVCFWHIILNLLLIVINFPAIKNPGPYEDVTCLYQNARGFVPFKELGEEIPCLDANKIIEFQTYIFEHRPSIIVLTETWLCKEHNDNEIFPNSSYRCFRLDRSPKTHPPDKNDPEKFKKRGGGVLIAIRSDLEMEPKKVSMNSKAEIISVELNLPKKVTLCVTACYLRFLSYLKLSIKLF